MWKIADFRLIQVLGLPRRVIHCNSWFICWNIEKSKKSLSPWKCSIAVIIYEFLPMFCWHLTMVVYYYNKLQTIWQGIQTRYNMVDYYWSGSTYNNGYRISLSTCPLQIYDFTFVHRSNGVHIIATIYRRKMLDIS